jgi:phosphate/phosphite/phosphonate ABC transporter binding protein
MTAKPAWSKNMFSNKSSRFLLVQFLLFFALSLYLPPAYSNTAPKVKLGVLAYRGKEAADTMWSNTASYLTKNIPQHVFTIVPLDFHEIGPAVGRGDVDFVIANPEIYVGLEAQYGATRIATLKNKTESGAYKIFGGVIFTRADRSDIKDLRDLKGRKFMAVASTSLGGWTMAWREFKSEGIDPHRDFAELLFGGTHDAVVYAVRDGKVDAGTVRTDTLERMRDEGKIDLRRFRVLNPKKTEHFPFALSTRLYPEWPFAKVRQTPDELAQRVAIALMNMHKDDPAAISANIEGWTIPPDYQPVHELMKELKLGPYANYGKVTLSSAIRQHWYWFLLATFLLFLMALVTVYVGRLNRILRERTSELMTAQKATQAANEQLRQRHLETSVLYQVSSVISRSISMDKLLTEVLGTISSLEAFKSDKGGIFIIEGDRMKMIAHLGHSDAFLKLHKDMRVGDCLCGIVAKTGEMLICTNSATDGRHTIVDPDTPPHGHLIVPLKTKDRVEGVLDLYMPAEGAIEEDKLTLLLSIGNQLGIAIENAKLYEQTKALALRDSLTGLWNHEEILRILGVELARAEREGSSVGVIMADLDHFKRVNDTYGHRAGDAVLRVAAGRMLSLFRSYDAVGRFGGEEFVIVLPGCDGKNIAGIAERLRKTIERERMNTPAGMIPVTISLGVAISDKEKRRDVESHVHAADMALYRAKTNGRNRVEFASGDE